MLLGPDGDPENNPTGILFYRCGKTSFLGAVGFKNVIGVRPDVASGRDDPERN